MSLSSVGQNVIENKFELNVNEDQHEYFTAKKKYRLSPHLNIYKTLAAELAQIGCLSINTHM